MDLEKYRDPWMAQMVNKYIGFFMREFYVFDNFSAFKIKHEGITYQTVEHAYQAAKFSRSCPKTYALIREAPSAYDAQRLAREHADKCDKKFNEIKVQLMEKLLRAKLEQHPHVREKLLRTKNYPIVEDSPKDSFWGIGPNRDGQNMMGRLWMKLRTELQNDNARPVGRN